MQNNGGEEVFHPKGSGLSNIGYPTYQVRPRSSATFSTAADPTRYSLSSGSRFR